MDKIFLNDSGNPVYRRMGESWVNKNMLELYNVLKTDRPDIPISEKIYLHINGITVRPICAREGCNKPAKYKSPARGYNSHCCKECALKDPARMEKTLATNMERYGRATPLFDQSVRNKISETNKKKFGGSSPFASKLVRDKARTTIEERFGGHQFSNEKVLEKRKKTWIKKYGTDNPMKNKEVKEAVRKTVEAKYGSPYIFNTEIFKIKSKKSLIKKFGTDNPMKSLDVVEKVQSVLRRRDLKDMKEKYKESTDIIEILPRSIIFCKCKNCNNNFTINSSVLYYRHKYKYKMCTLCNPIGTNQLLENELYNFILSCMPNTKIVRNDRKILDGKEIDIYLPELSIGFEFNELYWHSSFIRKERNYHAHKVNLAIEKGIHLIHIWEDEWINKRPIVESRIHNILGLSKNKINVRTCKVVKISASKARDFTTAYHLQGAGGMGASLNLALVDKNKRIVSVMIFRRNNNDWEIQRMCTLSDVVVSGGTGKMLSYFIKNNKFDKLITFADKCWSPSPSICVYPHLGFEYVHSTVPGYTYLINGERISKKKYVKKYIKNKFVKMGANPNMTESELMSNVPRIYDAGYLLFEYKIQSPTIYNKGERITI